MNILNMFAHLNTADEKHYQNISLFDNVLSNNDFFRSSRQIYSVMMNSHI